VNTPLMGKPEVVVPINQRVGTLALPLPGKAKGASEGLDP